MTYEEKTFKRFLSNVKKTKTCWLWTGSLTWNGYPQFSYNHRKDTRVSRYSWEHYNKAKIPPKMVIDHQCNNPPCVNPAHLKMMTQRENVMRGVSPVAHHMKKEFCKSGHTLSDCYYTKAKTASPGHLHRHCRTCAILYRETVRLKKLALKNKNIISGVMKK